MHVALALSEHRLSITGHVCRFRMQLKITFSRNELPMKEKEMRASGKQEAGSLTLSLLSGSLSVSSDAEDGKYCMI